MVKKKAYLCATNMLIESHKWLRAQLWITFHILSNTKLVELLLFTELFRKDVFSLLRTNTVKQAG